jgi:hypothetical protein
MKSFAIRALFVAAAAIGLTASRAQAQVDVNVSIGGFYDELAPYGQWVDCSYGQCWVPARVAADWQPYSNGQWIYTQYGWTWASNDPWGGNPYHYGTWASIEGYGWSWVPGTVWAPAWVTWSYSNNYVGWAPLPPTVVFGASGYSGRPIVVRETQYVFVPTNRFVGGNVTAVRVPAQQSAAIFKQTRPVTGFAVSGGIVRNTALPIATIERASGGKIETQSIQSARTAPHAVAAGPAKWSVVAPAREVKAAVAARPQQVPGSSATAREAKPASAPADRGTGNPNVPKGERAQNAPKAPEASPIDTRRPPSEAPAAHRPEPPHQADPVRPAEASSKPKQKPAHEPGGEKPAAQAARPPAEPPAASHADSPRQAEPNPPQADSKPKPHSDGDKPVGESKRAPAEAPVANRPPPRPAEPGQKPKANPQKNEKPPVEKDQKPDAEKP